MPEKLKSDYLKNEKSFRSEIKNIFSYFKSALFRHTKQTSTNVANATFKSQIDDPIFPICDLF